jgi:hypothetical protein
MSRSCSISIRFGPHGALAVVLATAAAACVIEPNMVPDGGATDGGIDAGATDGGPDAGTVQGTVSATLGSSLFGTLPVTWSGTQLLGSASAPIGGANEVYVRGTSDTGGVLTFDLVGLAPNTTGVAMASIVYQAPSTTPNNWTCDPNPNTMCSGSAAVTSYDGRMLVGTFMAQFGAGSSSDTVSSASVTNGSFNLTLP